MGRMIRGKWSIVATATVVLLAVAGQASAVSVVPVSVKLTTDALGLGSADLNGGSKVDPDIAGKLLTSPTVGEGSFLYIQRSGLAGSGTVLDPLLLTVTAMTHLDTVTFPLAWGGPADYQAGIIYLTDENSDTPDGKDEGLGVRAFKVTDSTGLRLAGLDIEGSKDVSGGTGSTTIPVDKSGNPKPNGPPHVDEAVFFDFAADSPAAGDSLEVLLSKFDRDSDPTKADHIKLVIDLVGGGSLSYLDILPPSTGNDSVWEQVGADKDDLWKLKFAGLPGVDSTTVVDGFAISAIESDPAKPKGTAEHFLITGLGGAVRVPDATGDPLGGHAPEPVTVLGVLAGLGGLAGYCRRRFA